MSCRRRQCCKTWIRRNHGNLFLDVGLVCSLHSTVGVKENAIASMQNPHCFSILMFEARKFDHEIKREKVAGKYRLDQLMLQKTPS